MNIKIPKAKYPRIVKMYNNGKGKPPEDIADKYDVQPQTIRKILKGEHVYVRLARSPGRVRKKDYPKIVKLYKQGKSTRKIGRMFEVSHQQICNILEHCRVKRRPIHKWHMLTTKGK
jgi:DNA invertase Pin-like site-specific DNA recombinase